MALPNFSELGNPSLSSHCVKKLRGRPEPSLDRERSLRFQEPVQFAPDLVQIPNGASKTEKEGQIEALIGQVGFTGIDKEDLGVGHAFCLDLLSNVFHGQGIDVQCEDAAGLPNDFRRRDGEKARAAANLENPLAGFEAGSVENLKRISKKPIECFVNKGHQFKMQSIRSWHVSSSDNNRGQPSTRDN